ncbi:MAG: phytanoyl-CoA dioxygenase family protein [Myxococcota bacterium]
MLLPDVERMNLEPVLAHYREHGWARLGRVLGDEGLAQLRERSDDLMLGRVRVDGMFFQHDAPNNAYEDLPLGQGYIGPSLQYRKLEKLERDERFRAWMNNALFERIARAHIDGEVAIYRAVIFNKAAQGGTPQPWHQDGGLLWGLDRQPTLQIWTALDDATEDSGCVEVMDRSHLGGLAREFGGLVPKEQLEAAHADEKALPLPARAGEAMLVHNFVWHRSGVNRTAQPRRAFTVCYMSAATRCQRKKSPRQFFRVFTDEP